MTASGTKHPHIGQIRAGDHRLANRTVHAASAWRGARSTRVIDVRSTGSTGDLDGC